MMNKTKIVVIFSLATIVLSLILFAIPGQFVSITNQKDLLGNDPTRMGGYEFIFGGSTYARNLAAHAVDGAAIYSASGIAFLVLLVLAVVCYVFHKKSSALLLLAGIIMLVVTILLFCVKAWIDKGYKNYVDSSVGLWVPYLSASFLALGTIGTLYVAISTLVKESKQPYTPKKETYSYLKNK